ncbi:hypothetical protein ON010_g18024 [Phytophthora cinnamomi]|nr:hypothetical protein ON010_g18024 [Phytophthora cinnamomi]
MPPTTTSSKTLVTRLMWQRVGYSARAALGELTKYSKDIGSYVVKEAAQLKEASGNFGVGELTSTTAQSTSTGSAATSDSAPAVEKGDTTNADITQGETVSTESPVGTVAPYSQTADKETPTNEADVATQTEVGADADSNDVTQTTFQSTEARSISKCKVRQRH